MLNRQQLDQFHRDGLLVLPGVFGEEELRALWQAADQVQQEALAGMGSGHSYRKVDGHQQYFRTDGVLWQRHAAFRIATVHPGLLAAVGQCLGHPFMPINDSLVVKLPHSGVAIPWHQDPPTKARTACRRPLGSPTSPAISTWTPPPSTTAACMPCRARTLSATSSWNASTSRSCSAGRMRSRWRWHQGMCCCTPSAH